LGLLALGELPLNPAFEGITVLYARNQPWLRAYGLTAHPNLLGAILAMLLLWLLPLIGSPPLPPPLGGMKGGAWRQFILLLTISTGLLGLFVTFSRSAWLAFGVGLLLWLFWHRRTSGQSQQPAKRPFPLKPIILLLPLLLLLIFNYDLVLSRLINLKTPIEATSVNQRLSDGRVALQLINQHPWRGVGLGNYPGAAQRLDPDAHRVHNVPLYVTAELGLPATLLWLWLMLAPFLQRQKELSKVSLLPAWTAMVVINMFDTMVWWSSNWQTAILFALLVGQTAQSLTSASHRGYDSPEYPPE
jgi:O-antigen ligase